VNDTRNITKNCQQDVDEEISTTSSLKEDTERWENDSKNDLANIAGGERHFERLVCRKVSGIVVLFEK
jgi:hypothetical protein